MGRRRIRRCRGVAMDEKEMGKGGGCFAEKCTDGCFVHEWDGFMFLCSYTRHMFELFFFLGYEFTAFSYLYIDWNVCFASAIITCLVQQP